MEYRDQTIGQFVSNIASTNVVPAGGTGAAVVGATGTALCEMACIHTVESEGFADVAAELATIEAELERQRTALLDLAERDAATVSALLDAADDEEEHAAMKMATGVPLSIAEACGSVIEHAVVVTGMGNPRAVPDAVTGTYLVRGALQASLYTVGHNLKDIPHGSFRTDVERRVSDVEGAAQTAFEGVIANVEAGS
ncbi:MAG: cyclodeaminase/cyclohydrolase family protein [Haloarculaceae archaeon]